MKKILLSGSLLAASIWPQTAGAAREGYSNHSDLRIAELENQVSELRLVVEDLRAQLARYLDTRSSRAEVVDLPTSNSGSGHYRVKSGENLWKIARQHGISLATLQQANPSVDARRLKIGHRLVIPGSTSSQTSVSHTQKTSASPGGSYRIRKGDTLGHIAQRYGLSSRDLLAVNPGLNPRRLLIGKSIRLPGTSDVIAETRLQGSPPSPPQHFETSPPEILPHLPEEPAPTQVKLVMVNEERSMAELAVIYGTDVPTLNELNEVSFSSSQMVQVGSEIYVPDSY